MEETEIARVYVYERENKRDKVRECVREIGREYNTHLWSFHHRMIQSITFEPSLSLCVSFSLTHFVFNVPLKFRETKKLCSIGAIGRSPDRDPLSSAQQKVRVKNSFTKIGRQSMMLTHSTNQPMDQFCEVNFLHKISIMIGWKN